MIRLSLAEAAGWIAKGGAVFIGRKEVADEFGDSRDDVLKSFMIAVYVLPLYLFFAHVSWADRYEDAPIVTELLTQTVYYALAWVYWPVMMATISEIMGYPQNWARYVVVSNWVFTVPLLAIVFLTFFLGVEAGNILGGLSFGFLLWSTIIHGWLLQKYFKTSLGLTIALLVVNFLLNEIASEFKDQIILRSML